MKTSKYFKLFAAMMSVAALTGCDDWTPGAGSTFPDGTGGVSGSMEITVTDPPSTPTGRASVDVSAYIVTITKQDAAQAVGSWVYGEMPEIITLPAGNYTATVRSHDPEAAAWDKPYFTGSENFTIENNKVTYIGTVTCTFQAAKVLVKFSDELAAALGSDAKVEVKAGAAGTSLTWTANETRHGYFMVTDENPTLVAHFTGSVGGQATSIAPQAITTIEPGKYYVINYSLKSGDPTIPDEYGNITGTSSGINVSLDVYESDVDGSISSGGEDIDKGDGNKNPDAEEWPEPPVDPIGPDDPVDPTPGEDDTFSFTNGSNENGTSTIDFNGVNTPVDGTPYVVDITSVHPLSHLKVEIISESLTAEMLQGVGLDATFDLAEPGDLEEALSGSFHFPVKDGIIGQTKVTFDISPFVPLLNIYPGELHIFRLTPVDNEGNQVQQELKFHS